MITYLNLFQRFDGQRAHYFLMESIDQPRADVRYQGHRARLAWLESHCCACRYVEATPKRSLSIKRQGAICFREVVVAADLYWSISRVRNLQRNYPAAGIQNDLSRCRKNLSGNHLSLLTELDRGC